MWQGCSGVLLGAAEREVSCLAQVVVCWSLDLHKCSDLLVWLPCAPHVSRHSRSACTTPRVCCGWIAIVLKTPTGKIGKYTQIKRNIQIHFSVVHYVVAQPLAQPAWLLSPGNAAEVRCAGARNGLSKHRSNPIIKRSKKQPGH